MFMFKPMHVSMVVLVLVVVVSLAFIGLSKQNKGYDQPPSQAEFRADQDNLERLGSDFGRISEFLAATAVNKGALYAYDLLRFTRLGPNLDLHLLGHVVGDELYKQKGLPGMANCTPDFRNACSHSIVVGALLENGMEVFDTVNDVCRQSPGGSGAYTMCFHGFGHGVLAYTEYDMKKTVELCLLTGTDEYGQNEAHQCIGGAVMEMKDGIHDKELWAPQKAKFVDVDNPLSLCQADYMVGGAKHFCYVYITPYLFDAVGGHGIQPTPDIFADSMKLCEAEPEERYRRICYAGFGKEYITLAKNLNIQAMNDLTDDEVTEVNDWCDEAPHDYGARECKLEVVNSLYWGGENGFKASIKYCSGISTEDRDICFDRFYSNVLSYKHTPDLKKTICTTVPDDYQVGCEAKLLP